MRTTTININSDALAHNINQVATSAPTSKVMIMYKANAYGHGLDVCTHALVDDPLLSECLWAWARRLHPRPS